MPQKAETLKMVKRATKKRRTQAGAEERYLQKVDRAVARYGAEAVAKYFAPMSGRSRSVRGSRELGYVDLAYAGYNMDTTGTVTLIATVAQGASVNQRIGKKAMWKSIQGRGLIYNGTAAVYTDNAYLIVYDKRPTGSLPTVTDILVSANANAFNNDTNSGRFVILKRRDLTLIGNTTTPATGREAVSGDFYLKVNRPVVFKAAGTGAIGDIEEGALYFVTVGANAAGTGAATCAMGFRTRFVDV